MNQRQTTTIVPPWWEKSPTSGPIETAGRFCLEGDFWGTNLRAGHPKLAPDKAFHNPAPCAAAIPSSPTNPGLCSSRAVGASWPKFPATIPFFCAISAPASRPDSLRAFSPLTTVTRSLGKAVFTCTRSAGGLHSFLLASGRTKCSESREPFGKATL